MSILICMHSDMHYDKYLISIFRYILNYSLNTYSSSIIAGINRILFIIARMIIHRYAMSSVICILIGVRTDHYYSLIARTELLMESRILDPGSRPMDHGSRTLDPGPRIQGIWGMRWGMWDMETGCGYGIWTCAHPTFHTHIPHSIYILHIPFL